MIFQLNVALLDEEVHLFEVEHLVLVMMEVLLNFHYHQDREQLNQLFELLNLV
jgi:hypothetical protein